jgi:hypothetical protein
MLMASASDTSAHSNAVVGLILIGVFVVVIVALTVALVRAHIRLARATTELSFLRASVPTRPAPGPDTAWRN